MPELSSEGVLGESGLDNDFCTKAGVHPHHSLVHSTTAQDIPGFNVLEHKLNKTPLMTKS